MVGWIGQLAEVTLADLAGLYLVGVQDRRPVRDRRFGGNVLHGARPGGERDTRYVTSLTSTGVMGILMTVRVSLCTTPVAIANQLTITRLNHG
jgi:hypothetical protein